MLLGTIAVFRKKTTPMAQDVAQGLRAWAGERGIVFLDEEGLRARLAEKRADGVDLLVVLGGDGTLLSAVRALDGCEVPVLGVNLGFLGFLTEITLDELYPTLDSVLLGKNPLDPRMLLEAQVERRGKVIASYHVLNDVVVNKGAVARISDVEVRVDGRYLTNYKADGLIVATPTGSTGYSLSAGGPIADAHLPAILLTPICPHTLTHRPILLDHSANLEIRLVSKNGEVFLTLDGQEGQELHEDDLVRVRRSERRVLLVQSLSRDYYQVLRRKLVWGGRYGTENSV